jgi:hypothetical protein
MASDALLDRLAADCAPVRHRDMRREGAVLALLALVELAIFLIVARGRPDMAHALTMPSFWWKMFGMSSLAVLGVVTAVRSFDPAASPRQGLRRAAWFGALLLLTGWAIEIGQGDSGSLIARLDARAGVGCLMAVVMLSLPMLVALGILMRRAAPTDRPGSGLAAGLGAASWGTFVFLFECGHDDPFYVVAWYGLACTLVALAGRLILPRVAQW